MGKILVIIGIVIVLIAVAGFLGYRSLTTSPTTAAILYKDTGAVEFLSGTSWMPAQNEMEIKGGWKVRTLDGTATLVFFEGELLRLSQNSEVTVRALTSSSIGAEQSSGETWNRVTQLTGTRSYEIKTPRTVASVRGTAWNLKIGKDADELLVGEGTVSVKSLADGSSRDVPEISKVKISAKGIERLPLTADDYALLSGNVEQDITTFQDLRWREAQKNKLIREELEKRSPEEVQKMLAAADQGLLDLQKLEEQVPVEVEAITKIRKLTEKIVELNTEKQSLQQKT